MVCDKCEKNLAKVIVPDKWKEGASNTTEGGSWKINVNKLLSKKKKVCMELLEIPSALFASSKYTKKENIGIPMPTPKEFVQCVVNKCLTPRFTNKAMYNTNQMLVDTVL